MPGKRAVRAHGKGKSAQYEAIKHNPVAQILGPYWEASEASNRSLAAWSDLITGRPPPLLPSPTSSLHPRPPGSRSKRIKVSKRNKVSKRDKSLRTRTGLGRTDNNMDLTSWPQVQPINQKNYYTEHLKRDEQSLALRLQNEAARSKMVQAARDKDRALANAGHSVEEGAEDDVDMDDQDQADEEMEAASYESKVIIIHPGSQNFRIGLASDILPKTVPMVIARKSDQAEYENLNGEHRPKRRKVEDDGGELFDEAFIEEYAAMTVDLKARARRNGVRSVPNAREQAIIYNRKSQFEEISEHNDTVQINWTEIPTDPAAAPNYITGTEATRIPDDSNPRYKLSWPMRYGVFNEKDYSTKRQLLQDFRLIIEDAIMKQLKVPRKSWPQYSCVYVVPDLYERNYVIEILDLLFRDFDFARVTFMQEGLSASFGAGYSTCVVVDIGAQKTSICCVDEGMCVESSRVLLRYGGEDVTETFIKMMLLDEFPYADINLKRRYDFILAEELKKVFCTFAITTLTNASKPHEFDLRTPRNRTKHFYFKTYDQVVLAPLGFIHPKIFDNAGKLAGRRKLVSRSVDMYDSTPNDPTSTAQNQVLQAASQEFGLTAVTSTLNGSTLTSESTPKPKAVGKLKTPDRDDANSPQVDREGSPEGGEKEHTSEKVHPLTEQIQAAELRDATLPVISLVQAINFAIAEGAKGDDRKLRDYYGGIMAVGGGSLIPQFHQFLEEELHASQPKFKKELIVGLPPREIDPQVLVWKGASILGKLRGSNDTWIGRLEYDRLGSRILNYKCLWSW